MNPVYGLSERAAGKLRELLRDGGDTTRGAAARRAGDRLRLVRCDSATAAGAGEVLSQCYAATILDPQSHTTVPPDELTTCLLTVVTSAGAAATPTANAVYLVLLAGEVTADRNGSLGGRRRAFGIASGGAIEDGDTLTTGLTFPNTGLKALDTSGSHALTIAPGSDLTANRQFTIVTGDASRTLNISAADVTVSAFAATVLDDTSAGATLTTLGGTTVGQAMFTVTNPGAITFARFNADNSVTLRSAADFMTDLGLTSVGTEYPKWVKITKTYTDLAAANTDNNIELYALPAKGSIERLVLKHSAAFAGGGLMTYSLYVGYTSAGYDDYGSLLDVFAAPGNNFYYVRPMGTGFTGSGMGGPPIGQVSTPSMTGATSIRLRAVCMGANLDAATAGSVDVWLLVGTMP